MNKDELKMKLRGIDLHSYCNPIWLLYTSSNINKRDEAIDYCLSLDYSKVINKYSYFKKSYETFLDEKDGECLSASSSKSDTMECKLTDFLIRENLISSFNYKTYTLYFQNLLKKFDEDIIITAFNYSFGKSD